MDLDAVRAELFNEFEEEDQLVSVEEIDLPANKYSPLRKIAAILDYSEYQTFGALRGNVVDKAVVSYLLVNFEVHFVSEYIEEEDALKKLILADVAYALTGEIYNLSPPLPVIAARISLDVYNTLFENLFEKTYITTSETFENKNKEIEEIREEYQDEIGMYLPASIETLVPANKILELIGSGSSRLPFVETVKDLRFLIATNIYRDLLKDDDLKGLVDNTLDKTNYSMKTIFQNAICQLHHNFYRIISE